MREETPMSTEVYRKQFGEEPTVEVVADKDPKWDGVVSMSMRHGALATTLSLSPEDARSVACMLMDAAQKAEFGNS